MPLPAIPAQCAPDCRCDRARVQDIMRGTSRRATKRIAVETRAAETVATSSNMLAGMLANKEKASAALADATRQKTPFDRMTDCRDALTHLDNCGWNRSFHQRLFHEDFLKACTRIFWKLEPTGQFARDHQQVLVENNWEHLAQEVLISTPRRFGKTISVSMFAAAMLYAAPSVELSIYSTCKRISQKLLRNVVKFFYEICQNDLAEKGFKVVRQNMEEITVRGPEGVRDQRVVNSYPSKVKHPLPTRAKEQKSKRAKEQKSERARAPPDTRTILQPRCARDAGQRALGHALERARAHRVYLHLPHRVLDNRVRVGLRRGRVGLLRVRGAHETPR